MVTRGGKVQITFGVMGGHYLAMGHAHFLSTVLDYDVDVQTAIDLPRIFLQPGTDQVVQALPRRKEDVGRDSASVRGPCNVCTTPADVFLLHSVTKALYTGPVFAVCCGDDHDPQHSGAGDPLRNRRVPSRGTIRRSSHLKQ